MFSPFYLDISCKNPLTWISRSSIFIGHDVNRCRWFPILLALTTPSSLSPFLKCYMCNFNDLDHRTISISIGRLGSCFPCRLRYVLTRRTKRPYGTKAMPDPALVVIRRRLKCPNSVFYFPGLVFSAIFPAIWSVIFQVMHFRSGILAPPLLCPTVYLSPYSRYLTLKIFFHRNIGGD